MQAPSSRRPACARTPSNTSHGSAARRSALPPQTIAAAAPGWLCSSGASPAARVPAAGGNLKDDAPKIAARARPTSGKSPTWDDKPDASWCSTADGAAGTAAATAADAADGAETVASAAASAGLPSRREPLRFMPEAGSILSCRRRCFRSDPSRMCCSVPVRGRGAAMLPGCTILSEQCWVVRSPMAHVFHGPRFRRRKSVGSETVKGACCESGMAQEFSIAREATPMEEELD
mmetsp:Transcript_9401/g.24201  ORF Transcript_9401/g.24201 Transcript_9401/m.24201 type:complete len:233 (-) Transcript_9401:323-1021(-)